MDANLLMRFNFWALGRMGRCPYFQVKGACIYENFEEFSMRMAWRLNAAMPPNVMRHNGACVRRRQRGPSNWLTRWLCALRSPLHPEVRIVSPGRHPGRQPAGVRAVLGCVRAHFHSSHALTDSQLRRRCSFVKFLLALVKPFMSNKLKDRVLLLGKELAVFSQEMDPTQLPPCVTHAATQHQPLHMRCIDQPPRASARREFGGTLEEDPMSWFDEQVALEAAGH